MTEIKTCPVCVAQRLHTADERTVYHPLAGHGYQEGQGWSSAAAEQAHIAEVRGREAKANAAGA